MNKKPGRKIITFDWAIKTVLRDKANFDVLEGFLTALFHRPITILDLLESEGNRTSEYAKYNRVDLLAKTQDDERIIVEVQYLSEMNYLRRLAYGTAKTIVENIGAGASYVNVKKVYSVNLLYFDAVENGDDYIYHGKTQFTGFHTHNAVTFKKSLTGDEIRVGGRNIFPEYFLISLKYFTDVIQDDLDQWIYAFKNNEVLDEFTAPGIGALKEKFDYLNLDEKERYRFDKHIDYLRSEVGMAQSMEWEAREARRKAEEARQKGIEEGRRTGIEEGHRTGLEEGRQEGRRTGLDEGRQEGREEGREEERKNLVRSLRGNGMAIDVIATAIGLSEKAIYRLLDEG
ncbi:MAG: PD-(D/E)XK nuclease family transposase [Gammaproteobacteria bacterium]|nr:PD-(D/E)XK nuclease family transposase [Gammaproteobacteria bacterium]NNJ84787.1 hypothetical protein [Gammaproteobacteria bacterium]